ncbi:serine hydrolase [Altererythrobacter sp. TH136]|uniref:serine hydrolase n=1 Tax=Altererythrobacter sp. TH136 TaxID=2067415 RepID=UPI0011657837|nr:serine hydrolase [Altererythrobacter sp. TH136]QDM40104.1 serine hydrolase [Altererythrobacter sp. TH136]
MLARFALPLALFSVPAIAQPAPQSIPPAVQAAADGVAEVLLGKRAAAEVFSPAFLAAVPADKLAALTAQIAGQFGPLEGLEGVTATGPASGVIALRFGRAIYSGPFAVDAEGKVANLLLNDYKPVGDDAATILRDVAALPGAAGVLYAPLDGGEPLLALNADRQLAIGSTFKLFVLAALARQVEQGTRKWDEVVKLDDLRSLPSGQMQDWPQGAPVTLQTLATMMISISDNTATDQLIRLVGRDAIAEELRASGHSAPARTLPFLTTREAFALKADLARGTRYAEMSEPEQTGALAALGREFAADPATVAAPTFTAPTLIDGVEWFASPDDLRKLLGRIVALKDPTARKILAVSPSMPSAQRKNWAFTGFKGGSEPGVINGTWLLQKPDGQWRILTMSWNNPAAAVDQATLELIAQRILALP